MTNLESFDLKGPVSTVSEAIEETTPLVKRLEYPPKYPFYWRIIHSCSYLIGSILFLVGSVQYYTKFTDYELGGWCFTFGALGFVIADFMSFWINRSGFVYYQSYKVSYEKKFGPYYEPENSILGRWQRIRNGLNFFLAFLGSVALAVGCILFIPSLHGILVGTWIFIYGCSGIFLSQIWKVLRAGFTNYDNIADTTFRRSNYNHDIPLLLIEMNAILGALLYILGSAYFLPQYDTNDTITNDAASFFVAGSVFYLFGGLGMVYRYFFTGRFND